MSKNTKEKTNKSIKSNDNLNGDNFDIKIEHHKYIPHSKMDIGELKLVFSGNDINTKILNSLRRTIIKSIPIYAFAKELIDVKRIDPESGYRGSTPFNNDYMKLRLSNLPIIDKSLDTGLDYLHEEYWNGVDYLDREKIHEKEKKIEAFVSVANDTNDIKHVTTNDMIVYIDGEKKNLYDKEYPFLLISLNPKEQFICNMKGILGVGHRHTIWNSAGNCFYDDGETIPDKFMFTINGNGQFDEYNLFQKALKHIKKKLDGLKIETERILKDKEKELGKKINKIELNFKHIDHGICTAVNYEIQSHPDIVVSGISKRDLLVKLSTIKAESFTADKLLPAILESIDNLIMKFNKVENEFMKLIPKS